MLKVQQFLSAGAGNPRVARLSIGLFDLLPFTRLGEETQNQIKTLLMDQTKRQVEIERTAESILSELDRIEAQLAAEGLRVQPNGVVEVPFASNLSEVENFLGQAKRILQEAIKIFEVGWGQTFKNAAFHDALDWSTDILGGDHPITKLLAGDQKWIKHLITLRNDLEHPKKHGPFVRNYLVDGKDADGRHRLRPPSLMDGTDVRSCVEVYCADLFTFVEELFALYLADQFRFEEVALAEIPEQERDAVMPVRFRAVPKNPPKFPGR